MVPFYQQKKMNVTIVHSVIIVCLFILVIKFQTQTQTQYQLFIYRVDFIKCSLLTPVVKINVYRDACKTRHPASHVLLNIRVQMHVGNTHQKSSCIPQNPRTKIVIFTDLICYL